MNELKILYYDNALIAIHKPAGLLVHKSAIDQHETLNAMHILRDQIGRWVYPLHRLDRPTSGVLLFALSSEIAKIIGEQFVQQKIHKVYQAIVRGYIAQSGVIDHPIKPTADFKSDKEKVALKPAQEAITTFQRLGTLELPYYVDTFPSSRYSLVELTPKTGRKHQLRKHMKHLSHPIIGDPKYGKSKHNHFFQQQFNCHRLLLTATKIVFSHPITQQIMTINATVDGTFKEVADQFILD